MITRTFETIVDVDHLLSETEKQHIDATSDLGTRPLPPFPPSFPGLGQGASSLRENPLRKKKKTPTRQGGLCVKLNRDGIAKVFFRHFRSNIIESGVACCPPLSVT